MKAERFIKEKEILYKKPLNEWNRTTFKKTLNEFVKENEKEQLNLGVVSQQRELLLAYHRYLLNELSLDINEVWVDEHLKANNCG